MLMYALSIPLIATYRYTMYAQCMSEKKTGRLRTYSKPTTLRLSTALEDAVKKQAQTERRTPAEMMRVLIEDGLQVRGVLIADMKGR